MMTRDDIVVWLESYYPQQLALREHNDGSYGIYEINMRLLEFDLSEGVSLFVPHCGYSTLFVARNRVLGGWVCDEIIRRDPKYAYRPGNAFHEAFLASRGAEAQREVNQKHARESGERMWDATKRNPALMNRIAKKLEKGDTDGAVKELSQEELFKNAVLENPREMRQRDFWKSL